MKTEIHKVTMTDSDYYRLQKLHLLIRSHMMGAVLGVTRYLCNALRNIITFVVTK